MKTKLRFILWVILYITIYPHSSNDKIEQLGSSLIEVFNSSQIETVLPKLSQLTSEKSKSNWSTEELYDLLRQLYNDGGKAIYQSAEIDYNNSVVRFIVYREGLGDYWDEEFEKTRTEQLSLEQIFEHIVNDPVINYPGEGTYGKYSNSGFILLG